MKEENIVVKPKKETKKKPREIKKKYHIVKENEIRWNIMKNYGLSEEEIEKLNPNLYGKWLGLKPGDKIRIK